MIEETEEVVTQTEEPQETEPVEETLTPEQIADLKRKADVSSQNFERAKKAEEAKKALEEEVERLKLQTEPYEDTDVSQKLNELTTKINKIEEEKQMESIFAKYPAIKDKLSEFEQYKLDYPGVKLESTAKLFLADNDLLTEAPKRKGLEKAGGGQRVAPSSGKMTSEDAQRLRTTNYKEYVKKVKDGPLQISK